MLLLKVLAKSEKRYIRNLITKFKRVRLRYPLHVDVVNKDGQVYILSLDDGFSATFVYQAYFKAKESGLEADLLYARHIEPESLPEEVRRIGEKWSRKRLNKREVAYLKNISITEHMLSRW